MLLVSSTTLCSLEIPLILFLCFGDEKSLTISPVDI